jgi:hypothetical protein
MVPVPRWIVEPPWALMSMTLASPGDEFSWSKVFGVIGG